MAATLSQDEAEGGGRGDGVVAHIYIYMLTFRRCQTSPATVDQIDDIPLSEVQSFKEPALPWYSDQALPFEITVVAANEYGAAASAKLFGVEILNEGWGMSIDDSVNQMQATLVACRSEGTECAVSSYTVGRTTRCRPWAEAPPPSRVRTAPAPSTP